jgi:Fe-S-cluster containining protein
LKDTYKGITLRNHLEKLHSDYREIFAQVEAEIDSQLCGLPLRAYEKTLKERLARVVAECSRISEKYRGECGCRGCGVCCKFAVSEFSYEDLREKANNGDNFASQFVSVFVPYEKEEEYSDIFPEYLELLSDSGKYYVYHCPKVTDDNRCSDYDNRPQICRDFPDNPIAFLPKTCGYMDWKLKSEMLWLKLRAEKEIINHLLSK